MEPNNTTADIAIIFPYRDRLEHYRRHMASLMSHPQWDRMRVIVVEQDDSAYFRRGWLLNIGIILAGQNATCIVTHDIDIVATPQVDYAACSVPTQPCSSLSCYNNGIPYNTNMGGVVNARASDWAKVNGYTNLAHGWGGEDDELYHRFRQTNLLEKNIPNRPPKKRGHCDCLHDEHHTERVKSEHHYKQIVHQIIQIEKGGQKWKEDGLNSIKFSIASRHFDEYGTDWIQVHDDTYPETLDRISARASADV